MYTTKKSMSGETFVIPAKNAHKAHAEVTWYDGGIWARMVHVLENGETAQQCAERVAKCPARYRDTVSGRRVTWVD